MEIEMSRKEFPDGLILHGKDYPKGYKYKDIEMSPNIDRERYYRIDLAFNCCINMDKEYFLQLIKTISNILDDEGIAGIMKMGEENESSSNS